MIQSASSGNKRSASDRGPTFPTLTRYKQDLIRTQIEYATFAVRCSRPMPDRRCAGPLGRDHRGFLSHLDPVVLRAICGPAGHRNLDHASVVDVALAEFDGFIGYDFLAGQVDCSDFPVNHLAIDQ